MICPHDEYIDEWNSLKEGVSYNANIAKSRNIGFHRKYFAFLKCLLNMLDGYTNKDFLRDELMLQMGRFDEYKTINGNTRRVTHSIAFDKMDQIEFEKLVSESVDVALKMLWKQNKHLTKKHISDYENILISFF